jgi:NAD(P)-dependent dehydrogenase (short-subunit alcohol dehydrogenase family)
VLINTPMIDNQMIRDHFAAGNPEDHRVLVNAIPVAAVEPLDISNIILWLCSDESRYFTGNAVPVDVGASLR